MEGGELPSTDSFPKWLLQLGLGQVKIRDQELHPSYPCRWQGPKHLDHHLLSSQAHYKETGSKMKKLGLGLALPYGMLVLQAVV